MAEGAIKEYADNESKLSRDGKALDKFRSQYRFKRSLDGRVSVQSRAGTWYSVRPDMEVAGAVLLRDQQSGGIYALQMGNLTQVAGEKGVVGGGGSA